MQKINQIERKAPVLKFLFIIGTATSVILILTITPWNIVPTLVTEDITVIAVTEYGCVGESVLGHSVVVSDCSSMLGDTISATFYVPSMELNGYYDKIQEKLATVNP